MGSPENRNRQHLEFQDIDSGGPTDTLFTEQSRRPSVQKNHEKYLKFLAMDNRPTRFSPEEIDELRKHFSKASSKQKIFVTDKRGRQAEQLTLVMKKEQFR